MPSQGRGDDARVSSALSCVFCERDHLQYVLKETPSFLLVADHAPLVEGHLLIIPRTHYACYGAVPAELDAELLALKQEVRRFAERFYAALLFWEHGVFRQTVFHAHLHCIPFGIASYHLKEPLHSIVVQEQEDLRRWYRTQGAYFYLEDTQQALLFPAEQERYQQVVLQVLWGSLSPQQQRAGWHQQEQRRLAGRHWLPATAEKWQQFHREQEEGCHADRAGTR